MSQRTMTTKTVKTVTVEKRGGFHDDSFFKDSWDNYEQAMKDVVCKYDPSKRNQSSVTRTTTTTKTTQNQQQQPKQDNSKAVTALDNTYRQIRTSNITKDESQAVSCVEEDTQYKMVVDAKDYKPDEINVKVTDDNVIIVEGKIEKKEGNKTSSQSFTRRFMLPGSIVDFTKISSALSKDGILKIIAPKKSDCCETSTNKKKTKHMTIEKREQDFQDDTYFKDEWDTFDKAIENVMNKYEKNTTTKTTTTTTNTQQQQQQQVQQQQQKQVEDQRRIEEQRRVEQQQNKQTTNSTNTQQKQVVTTQKNEKLDKYRQIRDENINKDDSQASSLTDEGTFYKMIIDVKDYKVEDINIFVNEENVIIVQGKISKQTGNVIKTYSFERKFMLPAEVADFDNVTSTISKDGMLKIICPQKEGGSTDKKKTIKKVTTEKRDKDFKDDAHFKDDLETFENAIEKVITKYENLSTNTTTTTNTQQQQQKQTEEQRRVEQQKNQQTTNTTNNITNSQQNQVVKTQKNEKLDKYRQIRNDNINKDDSQAASLTDEGSSYKMIIDVTGYKLDDLNILINEDDVIIVQGKIEKKVGNSTSSKSFERRFMLPADVTDFDRLSSALSKDGILKLICPKKEC